MGERAFILAIALGAGALFLVAYSSYRRRAGAALDRLDVDALGLELMSGCCAFVVFTTPTCRPCKAVLKVVSDAVDASPAPTEIVTVDAVDNHELALHCDVRTVPTTFLITASGHVIDRWRTVPHRAEVDAALQRL
ncbi:MAG TPA: thioredoxin family protein [Actinomycetota bacterium]|nr:thioredoxin family protein [Actinomycetota bacterium]